MSPPTVSKAQVDYPIYAATFGTSHHLIVGGGGGAGRHGVGNKITSFDFSSRAPTAEPTAEIELSRDEDSVQSLANLTTRDGVILFAGINSSEEQRLKDRNDHFRTFEVVFPKNRRTSNATTEKKSLGKITLLSKTSLFNPPSTINGKKDTYQRLMRLSPAKRSASGNKRIGAIASSLAGDDNEIVVFNATTTKPQVPGDIVQRIELQKGHEAEDLDILELEEAKFKLAYSSKHDVYVQDIHYDFGKHRIQGKVRSPEKKYTVPYPDVFEKKGRFDIRFIRWLSPSHLLLLANLPRRTGVELQVLRLYGDTMGSITLRKRLPKHVNAATGMDVAILDSDAEGSNQIIVAVGGADMSLSIFTIDYDGMSRTLSTLHSYATYREVHAQGITKVLFSPFFSPWTAPQSSPPKKPGVQYLKLASTSFGHTISVETFELHPISSKPRARYVLSTARSRFMQKGPTYFVMAFVVLVIALLAQSVFDPEGNLTKGLVPENIRRVVSSHKTPGLLAEEIRAAGAKAAPEGIEVPVARTSNRIRDFLHLHRQDVHEDAPQKALVIQHDPDSLSTEIHEGSEEVIKKHTEAKKWEELSQAERARWKEKLTDAGIWAVEEGETILKGIFFGQIGGLVGQVAQGVING
ncbi:hypothetical protein CC78DRAFT_530364 [Lojkania enalia]|uniref:Guanine nucleotide-exchange factor SEC12 n=1 Tax=Lojkania enalia TaxID=147567 RepID=A0A9P4KEZ0_9PLEO|nr:hypothetical protein CC78DRAFT_530364 [Didymosphaeria enalia]